MKAGISRNWPPRISANVTIAKGQHCDNESPLLGKLPPPQSISLPAANFGEDL
jgi:hypothetical protein